MYLRLDEIHTVQLDHTSRCNLKCPQCARTAWHGGANENVPKNKDLSVENYRTILEPFRDRRIKIFHCGSYGDVAASPTFVETFDFCQSYAPRAYYTIITNGSMHNPDWWSELGRKLSADPKNRVCFSIDGLEDTNSIYRVNSNFKRIIANLEAFNRAGGRSRWDYLVFEHNRHQVGEARKLAQELGVLEFNVKNTSRFVITDLETYAPNVETPKTKVKDVGVNQNAADFESIKRDYTSFADYAARTPITCKYKRDGSIFIDFEMRLWPCCWTGAPLYADAEDGIQLRHVLGVMKKYGHDFNRLDLHGWRLLEHDFFKRYIGNSWNTGFDDPDTPRLFTCGRTCGERFEFSSGYGKNRQSELLSTPAPL